jgi:hypothetical protein
MKLAFLALQPLSREMCNRKRQRIPNQDGIGKTGRTNFLHLTRQHHTEEDAIRLFVHAWHPPPGDAAVLILQHRGLFCPTWDEYGIIFSAALYLQTQNAPHRLPAYPMAIVGE